MKVLIAPMASMAETSGPFGRSKALAAELVHQGHDVAMCAAEEINYQPVDSVYNYSAPIPSPMGLPKFLGDRMFKMAQITGLQRKRVVHSFEEVLHIVGATDQKFFPADVDCILNAIDAFGPDILYAEFRPAAIVAAKLAGVKTVAGYSFPVQKSYACSPQCSHGVRDLLRKRGLPDIASVLDLFLWADERIVPSSYALEPIQDRHVHFTGPFTTPKGSKQASEGQKKNITVYMGNGSITPEKTLKVLNKALCHTSYEIYIASKQLKPIDDANIHVRDRFDFSTLLPDSAVFINHGGQNSIMSGLLYGVPQIVCPGNVFERKYNADSVRKIGAGVVLEDVAFQPDAVMDLIDSLSHNHVCFEHAGKAGAELLALGGVSKAVEVIEFTHARP